MPIEWLEFAQVAEVAVDDMQRLCTADERPQRTPSDNVRTKRLFMTDLLSSAEQLPARVHYDQKAGDRHTRHSGQWQKITATDVPFALAIMQHVTSW